MDIAQKKEYSQPLTLFQCYLQLTGYLLIIRMADCLAHLSDNPELEKESDLPDIIESSVSGTREHRLKCGLKWDGIILESWLA